MPEIILEPGESEKIVSQPERAEEYNLDVSGADVYLSHNPQGTMREGKHLLAGDRATLKNLSGSSIYAKNPPENTENVSIDISRASFNLIFNPRDSQRDITSNSAESLDYDSITMNTDVAAGDDQSEVLRPPPGQVWEVHTASITMPRPPSSTTGYHTVTVKPENAAVKVLAGTANYDSFIGYQYGRWDPAMKTIEPSDPTAAMLILKGFRIDNSNGLEFAYHNGTDVTQTDPGTYNIYTRRIEVDE